MEEGRAILTIQVDVTPILERLAELITNRPAEISQAADYTGCYDIDEAAEVVGIAKSTMYEKVKCNEIPAVRIGRRIKIPKAALNEWLKKQAEKKLQQGQFEEPQLQVVGRRRR